MFDILSVKNGMDNFSNINIYKNDEKFYISSDEKLKIISNNELNYIDSISFNKKLNYSYEKKENLINLEKVSNLGFLNLFNGQKYIQNTFRISADKKIHISIFTNNLNSCLIMADFKTPDNFNALLAKLIKRTFGRIYYNNDFIITNFTFISTEKYEISDINGLEFCLENLLKLSSHELLFKNINKLALSYEILSNKPESIAKELLNSKEINEILSSEFLDIDSLLEKLIKLENINIIKLNDILSFENTQIILDDKKKSRLQRSISKGFIKIYLEFKHFSDDFIVYTNI